MRILGLILLVAGVYLSTSSSGTKKITLADWKPKQYWYYTLPRRNGSEKLGLLLVSIYALLSQVIAIFKFDTRLSNY